MVVAIQTLEDVANAFLRKEYGLTLEIPIRRNNRYRTTMGMFFSKYDEESGKYVPISIEIAGWVLERCHTIVIVDTIKHECVHYALCKLGRQYHDGEADFETELKRLGISSNYD